MDMERDIPEVTPQEAEAADKIANQLSQILTNSHCKQFVVLLATRVFYLHAIRTLLGEESANRAEYCPNCGIPREEEVE